MTTSIRDDNKSLTTSLRIPSQELHHKPTSLSRLAICLGKLLPRGYFRVLQFAANRDPALQDFPINIKGLNGQLRADLREPSYIPLFRDGNYAYQSGNASISRALIRRGAIVYDVGANVGFNTLLYSEIVGSEGLVLALEPSPKCYGLLVRSLASLTNIRFINAGASAERGKMKFYETPMLATSSLEAIDGITPYDVDTYPLDMLVEKYGMPNFIKIDVEGHEEPVFRGMRNILSSGHPRIIFESLTDESLDRSFKVITSFSRDYRLLNIRNNGTLGPMTERATHDYLALHATDLEEFTSLSRT